MASLNDLQVYSEYAYSAHTQVLRQQIDLFNGATRGGITLRAAAHQGDFSDEAFYKKITGLVRRRDAYDIATDVTAVNIEHLEDTSVKVAAGTPPVNLPPSQYLWIQRDPGEAGAAMGQQLALDTFADMLNSSLTVGSASISSKTALTVDKSGETINTLIQEYLIDASALFGDRSQQIACWVMHSKSMNDLWKDALANGENLFNYGNVNVVRDPFGRIFVITDSASLHYTDTAEHYRILGLVPGGLYIGQNNDFNSNWSTTNGKENIQQTFQAEWSFNLGVKGFAWDKTNGGKNPDDAALATATNWDSYYHDVKDAAGVCLITE